jgi:hypothetical protein
VNSINGIIMTNANPANSPIIRPVVLVQAWCFKDEEVIQYLIQMLLDTFGNIKTVVEFVKTNNIRVG